MLNPRRLIGIVSSALSTVTRPTLTIRVRSPRYFAESRPVRAYRHATNGRGFAEVAIDQRNAAELAADPSVWQQLTRRTSADGADQITGSLQSTFDAEERTSICHLVFCPAFARVPTLEIEPSAGPDCRIKATHVYPYGARIEIKLSELHTESTTVRFDYMASDSKDEQEETEVTEPVSKPGAK